MTTAALPDPQSYTSSRVDRVSEPQVAGSWGLARAQVALFGPIGGGWKVEPPLLLSVNRDNDGRLVVSEPIFDVYGVGTSWDAAVRDYADALIEFFEITREGRDDGSRALLAHLGAYLKRA